MKTIRDMIKLVEAENAIGLDTQVVVDTGEKTVLTLGEFFDANEELTAEEIHDIKTGLVQHGRYEGGGGAAAEWSISLR